MVKKSEEKLMREATDEAMAEKGNISHEHTLSTGMENRAIASPNAFKGVSIEGLESVPASMEAVPFVRLVQPTSQKTQMANGKEALVGSFLFNDTQEAYNELEFVLLRAKHEFIKVDKKTGQFVTDEFEGETLLKPRVSILGIVVDLEKLFILSLSATSFSSFGKLIAKLKAINADKSYRFLISATSEKQENNKGKYYIVNFKLGQELDTETLMEMEKKALEYGVVLDRQFIPEEE